MIKFKYIVQVFNPRLFQFSYCYSYFKIRLIFTLSLLTAAHHHLLRTKIQRSLAFFDTVDSIKIYVTTVQLLLLVTSTQNPLRYILLYIILVDYFTRWLLHCQLLVGP